MASGAFEPVGDERVQLPQERGERLARAGRREDERVGAAGDGRPAGALRRRWLAERLGEPLADDRMEVGEGVVGHRSGTFARSVQRGESIR